ncbi:hypothetical protein FZEAL_7482 [Fusarium zealandicum]|uniref:Nucleoside-diphosphate-sugar epimerase n=1 Tax=Fusarium zealandicum TaxID=1053134 RepID=A0A8H4UGJ1_9HYPO|nr:hypothetical protein FZEAL_7482 [Fusarium zealandicum]
MKVLIVGASGMVGGEVLTHCLAHSSISSVVAFVRRDLPSGVSDHPKLECVLVKDFSNWPQHALQAHADAAAMLWNMGTYDMNGNRAVDLEYPLAFMEEMARVLQTEPRKFPFKYVHLSGTFVRQDQEKKLWFLEQSRKLKGVLESRALAFAESHANIWKTSIVKPGLIVSKNVVFPTIVAGVLGENLSIRVEELGAFMTYLAVDGEGEDSTIENTGLTRKGKELLDMETSLSK